MSRGGTGPVSFLWLHRWAGASLRAWDTPHPGCKAKASSPPWGPTSETGGPMAWGVRSCEQVRVQSPGLAVFHVVLSVAAWEAVAAFRLSGVAAFIVLRGCGSLVAQSTTIFVAVGTVSCTLWTFQKPWRAACWRDTAFVWP